MQLISNQTSTFEEIVSIDGGATANELRDLLKSIGNRYSDGQLIPHLNHALSFEKIYGSTAPAEYESWIELRTCSTPQNNIRQGHLEDMLISSNATVVDGPCVLVNIRKADGKFASVENIRCLPDLAIQSAHLGPKENSLRLMSPELWSTNGEEIKIYSIGLDSNASRHNMGQGDPKIESCDLNPRKNIYGANFAIYWTDASHEVLTAILVPSQTSVRKTTVSLGDPHVAYNKELHSMYDSMGLTFEKALPAWFKDYPGINARTRDNHFFHTPRLPSRNGAAGQLFVFNGFLQEGQSDFKIGVVCESGSLEINFLAEVKKQAMARSNGSVKIDFEAPQSDQTRPHVIWFNGDRPRTFVDVMLGFDQAVPTFALL